MAISSTAEQRAVNSKVPGSNPGWPAKKLNRDRSGIEKFGPSRKPHKLEVAGSNPATATNGSTCTTPGYGIKASNTIK